MKRIAFLFLVIVSCADPVRNAESAALGPEDPNVPRGEMHRPGQPCLVCHDDFSLAGTIYYEDRTTPFNGASVSFVDAAGNTYQATTNAAGNFIVRKSDFVPVFPIGAYTDGNGNAVVGVTVTGSDPNNAAQMITHIGRDGACAMCHTQDGPTTSSPGPVYVSETPP